MSSRHASAGQRSFRVMRVLMIGKPLELGAWCQSATTDLATATALEAANPGPTTPVRQSDGRCGVGIFP